MSKSKGNILDPLEIVEKYGLDPLRYYLIKEVSFGNDGNISEERLEDCINSDLAIIMRSIKTISFALKNCDNKIPAQIDLKEEDKIILNKFTSNIDNIRSEIEQQNINYYINFIVIHY